MRKPNYNFERSQRDIAKKAKKEAKLQKRQQEQGEEGALQEVHPEDEARGGQEAETKEAEPNKAEG